MGKRGHNEGSIYQRADGRWVASLTLHGEGGKRERKSYYGQTRREARAQLTRALRDLQLGLPLPGDRQTLAAFLEQWLADIKNKRAPKTHASYAQLVRLHIAPSLGSVPLSKLSPQQVQAFLNHKQEAGLSNRTVQYLHAVLRAALTRALKWGLVARNVATLVDVPSVHRHAAKFLPPEDARRFLDAIASDRLAALYTVALAVGVREGEALGLCWQDIDLAAGVLHVRTQLQRIEGKLQLKALKTEGSRRAIQLPAFAVAALRAHQARQEEERIRSGELWERWEGCDLVFTTLHGRPLDSRNVIRRFKQALEVAGLPAMRFYDLRHSCASLLLAQGVHPRVVMEILGHSQISLTMNTYSHVTPSLQREAASRMDELIGSIN